MFIHKIPSSFPVILPWPEQISVAKNYLQEDEIKLLGLIVEQYLAFAETMALENTPMYMKDWISRLDVIVQLNGKELLIHAGEISHQMALEKSSEEFKKYKETQKQIDKENSLKEIEQDIKTLSKNIKKWIINQIYYAGFLLH